MTELTKKQKIYVLKEMIRYYENIKGHPMLMCSLLYSICRYDLKIDIYVEKEMFTEFMENKPEIRYSFIAWFPYNDKASRLNYCKKILKIVEGK